MHKMTAGHSTIVVQPMSVARYADRLIEMCEHKGIGHPDTITDIACEAAALALAQTYLRIFGKVLHFNVDKGLLVAGCSEPRFSGGRILEPAKLIICGRASNPDGQLDIAGIVTSVVEDCLKRNIRIDPGYFQIVSEIKEGSTSLKRMYANKDTIYRANDTSFGVGFAPQSILEQQVLHLAFILRSKQFHDAFPSAGRDFKIMGLRTGMDYSFTVALAMIDRHINDTGQYFAIKDEMVHYLRGELEEVTGLMINALDDPDSQDESGLYLTVSGLSAEMGDDGQVGRGNRINGLITPGRLMSLEAVAGKNPVAHVGKIYNVLANKIANAVHTKGTGGGGSESTTFVHNRTAN
jgi:S-adenosylmethionine synthetase